MAATALNNDGCSPRHLQPNIVNCGIFTAMSSQTPRSALQPASTPGAPSEDRSQTLTSTEVAPQRSEPDAQEAVDITTASQTSPRHFVILSGALFESKKALQVALNTHAAVNGYQYRVESSNQTKFTAVCKVPPDTASETKKCPFRLYARGESHGVFSVVTWKSEHTCAMKKSFSRSCIGFKWVAGIILDYVKENPSYSPKLIISHVRSLFGVQVSYKVAWSAREHCLKQINGTAKQSYAQLRSYLSTYSDMNENAGIEYETVDGRFSRLLLSFSPCVKGYQFCRPIISLDACHLKGEYKGQLFSATNLDAQNELMVIAIAVCGKENSDNWLWFLRILERTMGPLTSENTLISDRQKGLVHALTLTFKNAQKCLCLKHLANNVRSKFRTHHTINQKLWASARTCNHEKFIELMEEIKSIDSEAHRYISESNPELWANSLVSYPRFGVLTSNTAECFNSWVGEETRSFPVLRLVRHIVGKVADRFCKRELYARQIEHDDAAVTPYIRGRVQENSAFGRRMDVLRTSTSKFVVSSGQKEYNVDVSVKNCSCGHWKQLGIPCAHSCDALLSAAPELGMELYSQASDYFSTCSYKRCYSGSITVPALPDPDALIPEDADKPPASSRQPGRPAKRRRQAGDASTRTVTCGRCGKRGHNRASCQEPTYL